MIDHCLEKLVEADVENVIVNVHYLPDLLEEHLGNSAYPVRIQISDEREQLMETGGGLVKAQPMIKEDPFFCLNSDNLWKDNASNAFEGLSGRWDSDNMDALLLLIPISSAHNYSGSGDFSLDENGRISKKEPGGIAPYIYSGIQLLSKRLLRDPPAGPFSTMALWTRAIEEGRLFGLVHDCQWFEVGSPGAITPTETALAGG